MNWGMIGAGLVMGIAAMGSAIGIGIAGQGAIGAWKRCYLNNKPAPFLLVVFAGAPLTQTIYGFLLMNSMKSKALENAQIIADVSKSISDVAAAAANQMFLLGLGIAAGLAMCMSAVAQGKAGAAGSDALGETGKGFTNYIMVVGLCETVALFAMVFGMIA
ncbi:MAG: V-type ATP synthase subunit K [Treponema sp.]|nr:V-type ATP synthase subunit K [Spirochaetales bacterium]MDY4903182.1 V-type ATP synthase subunit K [Treponema sp.]